MQRAEAIDSFRGPNYFLSNYFGAPISVNGLVFPTNEHAFAAFKTTDLTLRAYIAQLPTPGEAKKHGRALALRPDWEEIKVDVMRHLIFQKFKQHPDLALKLLETRGSKLIEGNTWGDREWGVDEHGVGKNLLGRLLMERRGIIRRQIQEVAEAFGLTQPEPTDLESANAAGNKALLQGVQEILGIKAALALTPLRDSLQAIVMEDSGSFDLLPAHTVM